MVFRTIPRLITSVKRLITVKNPYREMSHPEGHATAAPAPPPPAQPPPPFIFRRPESATFWGLVHHSDNATHFKSNKMMHYWTQVKAEPPSAPADVEPPLPPSDPAETPGALPTRKKRLSMLWVEFGCAGHGKGPWDGLGAMLKQARATLTNPPTFGLPPPLLPQARCASFSSA